VPRPLLLAALVRGCHLVLELDRPPSDAREPVDGPSGDLSLCAWTHRRKLTFDNTLQPQDLKGFPVLVTERFVTVSATQPTAGAPCPP